MPRLSLVIWYILGGGLCVVILASVLSYSGGLPRVSSRIQDEAADLVSDLRGRGGDSHAATPEPTATDSTVPPTSGTPGTFVAPVPGASQQLVIANTGGAGVIARSDCTDEARTGKSLSDGEPVDLVADGVGRCEGWTMVRLDGETVWLRAGFLDSSAPAVSVPSTPTPDATPVGSATPPPTSTTSSNPTPLPTATATPSPTATATPTPTAPPVAVSKWIGTTDAAAGSTITALIRGVACASTTVVDNGLGPEYALTVPDTAPCHPATDETVTFQVNFAGINTIGRWQPATTTFLHLETP